MEVLRVWSRLLVAGRAELASTVETPSRTKVSSLGQIVDVVTLSTAALVRQAL